MKSKKMQSDNSEYNHSSKPFFEVRANAEREREVKAMKVRGKNYVLYQTKVHVGTKSSSWLANNPGNMDLTSDTRGWGAYEASLRWGKHKMAIFPSVAKGLRAMEKFFRKHEIHAVSKNPRNILTMMWMWAPKHDGENDPKGYAKFVADKLGVPVSTLIKDLTDNQLKEMAKAMQEIEGWVLEQVFPRDDKRLPPEVNK